MVKIGARGVLKRTQETPGLYQGRDRGAVLLARSVGASDEKYASLDQDVVRVHIDGIHRLVAGLKAHFGALRVELLERGRLLAPDQGGDHVAAARGAGRLQDDDVAIADQGVNHGVSLHPDCEDVLAVADSLGRHFNRLVAPRTAIRHLYRRAGRYRAGYRDSDDARAPA